MAKLLVDANILIAAMNPTEPLHERARTILARAEEIIITELVLNETTNVLGRRISKQEAIRAVTGILGSGSQIVYLNNTTLMKTVLLFRAWNKSSLADAANVVLMQEHGITRIATFDKAFKQIPAIEVVC
jgi:predicted nucleic acid-binding protein